MINNLRAAQGLDPLERGINELDLEAAKKQATADAIVIRTNMEAEINKMTFDFKQIPLGDFGDRTDLIEELRGALALLQTDADGALAIFGRLADDTGLPEAIRDIIKEMIKQSTQVRLQQRDLKDLTKTQDGTAKSTEAMIKRQKEFNEILAKMSGIAKIDISDMEQLLILYDEAINKAKTLGERNAADTAFIEGKQRVDAAGLAKGTAAVDAFVERIVQAEAPQGGPNLAGASTAYGVGQFTEGTWLDMIRKYFPEEAIGKTRDEILALRADAELSRRAIRAYAKENEEALRAAGHDVTEEMLHLAHFLGATGAKTVLAAAPGTKVSAMPGMEAAIRANPKILGGGATKEDVLSYAARRAGIREAENKRAAEIADENEKLKELITTSEKQIALQEQINAINRDTTKTADEKAIAITKATAEMAKEAEVERLITQARAAGIIVDKEKREEYAALAQKRSTPSSRRSRSRSSRRRRPRRPTIRRT